MTRLVRASALAGRPVVTLAGDDVAQIKDVVYDGSQGRVAGFTLNGRGLFAGPLKLVLPWSSVTALGPDAVMIRGADSLTERGTLAVSGSGGDARESDVLGDRVLTESGSDLGRIVDVVVEVGATADVIGYEVEAAPSLRPDERRVLILLPGTIAVSDEAVIVPPESLDLLADDLPELADALATVRSRSGRRV